MRKDINKTRMHCSRMRPIRCSGCLMGGICLGGVCPGVCLPRNRGLPREGVCPEGSVCRGGVPVCLSAWGGGLPRGVSAWGMSAQGVSAQGGCLPVGAVCLGGVCQGGVYLPHSVDRILDTRLWKHYLFATSFTDGEKSLRKRRKNINGVIFGR